MIYSIIDIGSNSVRMSVYRINNDNSFTRLFSEKEMAGLINYIVDNNMTEEGIDKICEILDDFLFHPFKTWNGRFNNPRYSCPS